MRRSRPNNPKGAEGGEDSSPMVVGTGVTMDYSAVDNPSLDVSVHCPRSFPVPPKRVSFRSVHTAAVERRIIFNTSTRMCTLPPYVCMYVCMYCCIRSICAGDRQVAEPILLPCDTADVHEFCSLLGVVYVRDVCVRARVSCTAVYFAGVAALLHC